ncbi:MAG TPA: helix-turn-helix transcriptional regulator [Gemmatimonadaceae bacterium]
MGLIRGTLDVLVLKTVSWSPMAAFEITSWLEDKSDGRLAIDGPALIQALHRMEERELVAGEWGITANGRRARYYRITPNGRAFLKAETSKLADDTDALMTVLSAKRS